MSTRPTLPYYAPAGVLPAPLPTMDEIRASETGWFRLFGARIVRVNEHFVVKHGPDVQLQEGQNMLFVRQATSIRVPTVYALFHDEASGDNVIVQEYIPSVTLMPYWLSQDEAGKERIVVQLQRYLDELRRLPSPGYFCGVWEQDVIDFWCLEEKRKAVLPKPLVFHTEEQWADGMLDSAANCRPVLPERIGMLRHAYRTIFRGHPPVFTHGDLNEGNILIQPDGTVVLIDWQYAGWYPSFWEFCIIMAGLGYRDTGDWYKWVPRFLPGEYSAELGWFTHYIDWFQWGGA